MNQNESSAGMIGYIQALTEQSIRISVDQSPKSIDHKSWGSVGFEALTRLAHADEFADTLSLVARLTGTNSKIIRYLYLLPEAGTLNDERSDAINSFLFYCLSILTTAEIGGWYNISKTAVGERIHKGILELRDKPGAQAQPALLEKLADIRHIKKPSAYRRLLEIGLPHNTVLLLLAGTQIETLQNTLSPRDFALAMKILNEFGVREKYKPYDYESLKKLLSQRHTKQQALSTLTQRTAHRAQQLGIVTSLNGELKNLKLKIDITEIASRLNERIMPFVIIQRGNGYKSIYIASDDLQLVMTVLGHRNILNKGFFSRI